MDRRTFVKSGCIACVSMSFLGIVLESCSSVRYSSGSLSENGILLDLKEFDVKKKSKTNQRAYVIVRNEALQFPVCVYRINESTYTALLMRCSHQGAELQVAGDQLTCPAHGSEFDAKGKVMQGPATDDLRSFPVSVSGNQLFIDLRKQA